MSANRRINEIGSHLSQHNCAAEDSAFTQRVKDVDAFIKSERFKYVTRSSGAEQQVAHVAMASITVATSMLRRSRSLLHARAPLLTAWSQTSHATAGIATALPSQSAVGAVRTKVSERAQRRKNLRKMKERATNVPLLKDTLRKLYLRTHPDLFGQYPLQQAQNEASYKELLGILDSIEKHNEFPPAKTLVLPFALKTPIDGVFKTVSLQLRTTGGACNTLVEEALGQFFVDCGLPGVFEWNEGSWGKARGKDAVQNANLTFDNGSDDEHVLAANAAKAKAQADKARAEAAETAPAYHPVDQRAADDTSIERVLNELNDVLEIIAAVPLMDDAEYGELRRYYETGQGLDDIDTRGFRIKAATEQIWAGERAMSVLTKGVDADSALLIQRILMHTLAIEQKVKALIEQGVMEESESESESESDEVAESDEASEERKTTA